MGYLRLRQICLVAHDLATVEKQIIDVLGLEICYRDPGVGKYGLHNALFALGGTFLEVVSPTKPDTAAGRYLERRNGDGGYMYILDCDDLEARREHFKKMGVRLVQDLKSGDDVSSSEAIHLHPKDTGGCLLSVDRHSGGTDLKGGYHWAGPSWQKHDRSKVMAQIIGAGIQSPDPEALAEKWSELLQRKVGRASEGEGSEIRLDQAFVRFGPLRDDRGEGLRAVHLKCKDKAHVMAAAKKADLSAGPNHVDLCGVRFVLAD
jgi:Glyoxalase-like domain